MWQGLSLAGVVIFSMVFFMGSSTIYGMSLLPFFSSLGDYIRLFLANLPFVLTLVFVAVVGAATLVLVVITAIYLLAFAVVLFVVPLSGISLLPRLHVGIRWILGFAFVGGVIFGAVLLWPTVVSLSAGAGRSLTFAFEASIQFFARLFGYRAVLPTYFAPSNYLWGDVWVHGLWISTLFGLLLMYSGKLMSSAREFGRERRAAKARMDALWEKRRNLRAHHDAGDDDADEGARREQLRLVEEEWLAVRKAAANSYEWFFRAIRRAKPAEFFLLAPAIVILVFGAGVVKGRLDVEQGARIVVSLADQEVDAQLVATLERGVLVRSSSNRLTMYRWEDIGRLETIQRLEQAQNTDSPSDPDSVAGEIQ